MSAPSPQPEKRFRKLYVLWGAALGLLLSAAIFSWKVVVPAWRVRAVMGRLEARSSRSGVSGEDFALAARELGGPGEAVRRLALYLCLPERLRPNCGWAYSVLAACASQADGFAAVQRLLAGGSPAAREAAARALGEVGGPKASPALAAALEDGEPSVRAAAAEALGELRDPATIPALIAALKDGHWLVRWRATQALGGFAGYWATEPLAERLKDEDRSVRALAADVLGRIGDARALGPLIAALKDESPRVRYRACLALGKMGAAAGKAVPALRKLLADRQPARDVGRGDGLPVFSEPDCTVSEAAAAALEQIKSARPARP